jgi:hypothetical protein
MSTLPSSQWDPHREKCPSPESSSPAKKPPRIHQQSSHRESCSISWTLLCSLSKFPVYVLHSPTRFPNRPLRRHPSLEIAPSLRVPVRKPPPCSQQGPYGERESVSQANGHSIKVYWSPQKEPSYKMGKNIGSPSTEPHVDGRPTYNGVWPCSPTESGLLEWFRRWKGSILAPQKTLTFNGLQQTGWEWTKFLQNLTHCLHPL